METRACQNCKQNFNIEEDDKSFYLRISVPYPTFCPMCRAQRRLAFRNERGLYKNLGTHIHEGSPCPEQFKTGFSKDSDTIVYCEKCYQQEVI